MRDLICEIISYCALGCDMDREVLVVYQKRDKGEKMKWNNFAIRLFFYIFVVSGICTLVAIRRRCLSCRSCHLQRSCL